MTTPTPMARAVEAMAEALYHADVIPTQPPGFRKAVSWADCPETSRAEYRHMAVESIPAALPALLEAVSEQVEDKGGLAIQMARACDVSVGQPDVDGRTVGEIIGGRVQRLLLAALKDAAGRVG